MIGILHKEALQQDKPLVRRGRGRHPKNPKQILGILDNQEALKQVEPTIHRGRGRPPKQIIGTIDKEELSKIGPIIRRGRGRPRKNHDDNVAKPLVDILSKKIFKKPRSRTRYVGEFFPANSSPPSDCFPSKVEETKSFVDKEAYSSLQSNCVCYQPLSEIEMPGPIPNFETWEMDDHILSKFFKDIPDVPRCKFCRQLDAHI
ncbi:hypothetical protein ACH5RR_007358 [Cinchona calisaya]|uniref:Uncharacterized protein n=1 Tax=Cinchona calisaya TaxID=153742 RepID=A0ABD3ARJ9_9GENT